MAICTTSKKPTAPEKCAGYIPKTHGNLLRSMSDDDLARWIWAVQSGIKHEEIFSTDGWYVWLREEARE